MNVTHINFFSVQNVDLFFLSPYTNLTFCESGVYVKQAILNNEIFIKGELGNLKFLFEKLLIGIEYDELKKMVEFYLNEPNSDAWIELCMNKGVIE